MFDKRMSMLASTAVWLTALGLLGSATLHAEGFDPTRPPIFNNNPDPTPTSKAPKLNPQDFRVTSILLSEHRQVAVINNQVVGVGDTVKAGKADKATVTKISATEVTLSKARYEFVVRLPSSQYTKSAISGPIEGLKDQP